MLLIFFRVVHPTLHWRHSSGPRDAFSVQTNGFVFDLAGRHHEALANVLQMAKWHQIQWQSAKKTVQSKATYNKNQQNNKDSLKEPCRYATPCEASTPISTLSELNAWEWWEWKAMKSGRVITSLRCQSMFILCDCDLLMLWWIKNSKSMFQLLKAISEENHLPSSQNPLIELVPQTTAPPLSGKIPQVPWNSTGQNDSKSCKTFHAPPKVETKFYPVE